MIRQSSDLICPLLYRGLHKAFYAYPNFGSPRCEPELFGANPGDLSFSLYSSEGWTGDYKPWAGCPEPENKSAPRPGDSS